MIVQDGGFCHVVASFAVLQFSAEGDGSVNRSGDDAPGHEYGTARIMEDTELEALLLDMESDRVERKASHADTTKVREAICAFANDLPGHRKPGVLFVGVKDDGSCANITVSDQLLKDLASYRDDGQITPFPTMAVQKRTLRGCELAVVIVEPALTPPVRLRGRVCVRVGPRRANATPDEERILTEKRRAADVTFDIRAIRGASLSDLDLDLFRSTYLPAAFDRDVLAANGRTIEEQLASLRFLSPRGEVTVLATLVLGKDPRYHVPGAYIQFVRFDGSDLTAPIRTQVEIDGPLSQMLQRLDDVLRAQISVRTDIVSEAQEVQRPDYPIAALRQLAYNAVLHRNYETSNNPVRIYWFNDRVEITNPGGPFGVVTIANFGAPGVTDYRNPHLAEAMKVLGYVQRFGIGIQTARTELARNGNAPPSFAPQDGYTLVTVHA